MYVRIYLRVRKLAIIVLSTIATIASYIGNFRGKIIFLFSQICLQPLNFNYEKNTLFCYDINMAILENLFMNGRILYLENFPIYGIYIIYIYIYLRLPIAMHAACN